MGEVMRTRRLFRAAWLLVVVGLGFAAVSGLPGGPFAYAADVSADKEFMAVFQRGSNDQAFAVVEKPKGASVGAGTSVEIETFGLRVSAIDPLRAQALLRRLPALDRANSQNLPPGFKVYADSRYVASSYASGSQKYKITFTDPADFAGTGGSGSGAAGGPGSGGGGGAM